MKTVRIALIAGSALLLAAGGFSVVACGSDDNTGFPVGTTKDASTQNNNGADTGTTTGDDDSSTSTTQDSGGGGGDDTTGDDDSGMTTTGDDSSTGTMDAGVDCGKVPSIPSTTEGNYCFSKPVNGDDAGSCGGSKPSCCDTETSSGTFTNTCTSDTTGSACTAPSGGKAYFYGCGQKSDCSSTKSCYVFPYADADGGSIFIEGNQTCGYVPLASGSICATSSTAPAGSAITCTTDSDCSGQANGATSCLPVAVHSKYFGVCLKP